MTDSPQTVQAEQERGIVQRLADIAPALVAVGAVGYALVRYSYGRFYDVFGLAPEDAGVGEVSALAGSGLGLAYVAAFVFALFAVAVSAVRTALVFVARRRTRYERSIGKREGARKSQQARVFPCWRLARSFYCW